ncbi:MAG TPA: TAXI family TRAP transporter solute-binding subunit [Vicinamibacterales bacterium]|nr:TAXI family TRAP transporter solute-binding subunit [Vicinamibacterales bacterium]
MLSFRPLTVCVLTLMLAAGCAPGQSGATGAKRRLSIATGGTGGVFYPYGGGIAKVITDSLDNVEATAEVTAASIDNLKFIKQGTSDLAFTMSDTAQDAVLAHDVFAEFGAVPLRTLAVLYSSYTHLVTREDSGITDLTHLKGRVVSMGAAGSGTATLGFRMLEAAGLDPKRDIRAQSLGVAQSVDALKDGKIDAFFWNGGLPTASVLDLVNTPGIKARFLPTDALLVPLEKAFGPSLYYRAIIPKGMYKQDADVPVVGVAVLLVVSETMPETLAHDITRVLFDKQVELAGIHPQARDLSLNTAVKGSPIPFHPGAIKYYRERQVWTD